MNAAIKKSSSSSAFTLIELLVVIAIISILAAILFPVFAQAREKARQAECASNLKQLALGFLQYTQDYDEYTINVSKTKIPGGLLPGGSYQGLWYINLYPYVKDWGAFLCPDRDDTFPEPSSSPADFSATGITKAGKKLDKWGCFDNLNPTGYCVGYGYNDGPLSDNGGALLEYSRNDLSGTTQRPASNTARIVSTADFVIMADTYDNNSSSAFDNLDGSNEASATSGLRHNGLWNVAFADGHVKAIKMVLGNDNAPGGGGTLIFPANSALALDWCYDPTPNSGSLLPDENGYTSLPNNGSGAPTDPAGPQLSGNCYQEVNNAISLTTVIP